MSLIRCCCLLLVVASSVTLHAQSYTPREIRIEGTKAYALADILATAGLKQGASVSVKELDAAVQRLADTGLFSDTRYATNPQTLTLTLTPIDAKQMLPVRYGNFAWWRPGELTPLVHARVPLFNGAAPLNGGLMDSVKQALVALLAEKGVPANIDSMSSSDRPGGPITALTLMVASPAVKVGEVHFDGASGTTVQGLAKVSAKLSGDDFDEVSTPKAVMNDAEEVYRDDGYLDIAVDPPTRTARADGARFLVDVSTTVHGGELYRVAKTDIVAPPQIAVGDLKKLVAIKTGDPASQIDLRIAQNRLVGPYANSGYIDAKVDVDVAKDSAAHVVAYGFTVTPGEQYHVVSVSTSGLTPAQDAEVKKSFHPAPNAIFGQEFRMSAFQLNSNPVFRGTPLRLDSRVDRTQHTVAVVLTTGHGVAR